MPSSAIASLALLKVNYDLYGRDYLEQFVPLVAECVRITRPEVISVPEIQTQLRAEFGLEFPQHVVRTIVNRAHRRGYFVQNDRVLTPNYDRLETLRFRPVQQEILRHYETVVAHLIEYCDRRFGLALTQGAAEAALEQYFNNSDARALAGLAESAVPAPRSNPPRNAVYLVGSFVQELQKNQSSDLEYFDSVVKGAMLANGLYLTDPNTVQQKFHDTELYFDTPFLMRALGYSGEVLEAASSEVLDLLYATGADLRCFPHTVVEMRGILAAAESVVAHQTYRGLYGPIAESIILRGATPSDIREMAARLEMDLRAHRVRVSEEPRYEPVYQISEEALAESLRVYVQYRENERALDVDVHSISNIARIRKGRQYSAVETCRALFVTTNSGVVRGAHDFYRQEFGGNFVGLCVTDGYLANLIWLKQPTRVPALPRKRIIADAYAAVQPSNELWRKYISEIERLEERGDVSAAQYYVLRYDLAGRAALMEVTQGDEAAFTQGTIQQIVELSRRDVEAHVREELETERALRRAAESAQEAREQRIIARAERLAFYGSRIVLWIMILVVVLAAASAFMDPISESLGGLKYVLWVCSAVAAVLSARHLISGGSVNELAREFEVWMAGKLTEWQRTLSGA